jgi:hypothetical protein
MKLNSGEKLFEAFFSILIFVLINAGGLYLILADDEFLGIEYPVVQIVSYIGLYVISVVMLFGYRVCEINGVIKLATPLGKKVTLNADEIRSVLSFGGVFILKSDSGKYVVWRNLRMADKERFVAIAKKRDETGSE